VVENRSCVVNKGSSLNNRGSFNNWSSLDNWSSFNHRGSSNKRSSSIVKAIVVSVGKAIVIAKRMRVSNQWVVINKGAVSLTMSSNTAVVVSIGISLGIGISISFSLTTLTSKVHKGGNFMTMMNDRGSSVGYGSNMVNNRSNMMNKGDRMNLMRHNSWSFNYRLHNWSMGNSVSNWKCNRSGGYKRSSGHKRSSSWGYKGSNRGSSREVKTSVEEQLRISLSLTLMKTVDRLIAGTRERTSIARCGIWSVQVWVTIGSIVVQGIGFRLSQAERGYGENYDHALHDVYRTAV